MRGLIDADVRFQTAQDDLRRTDCAESFPKCIRAARTERRFFDELEIRRQRKQNLFRRSAETFRVLFGDNDRRVENLKSAPQFGRNR